MSQRLESVGSPASLSRLRDARVLVTGATGFVGRHLTRELSAYGAELFVLRRKATGATSNVIHSLAVDLQQRAEVAAALQKVKPEIIFHLAGFASGDRSDRAMAHAFDGNVVPTANVLLSCAEHLPQTRVIITTSLEASNPWRAPADTGSPYGVSKLMVELLAGGMRRLTSNEVVSARIGMAYGPDDPNRRRLVPLVVTSLLRGQSPKLGSGQRRCDFIHIDDVVLGLMAMALASASSLTQAAFDLGRGELVSVREVAELIHSLLPGAPALMFDQNLNRSNEQERSADVESTAFATGFRAQITLASGLSSTTAWYRAQLMAAELSA